MGLITSLVYHQYFDSSLFDLFLRTTCDPHNVPFFQTPNHSLKTLHLILLRKIKANWSQLYNYSSLSFLNKTLQHSLPATSLLTPWNGRPVLFRYNNLFPSPLNLSCFCLSRDLFLQIIQLMYFYSFITPISPNTQQIFIFLSLFIKRNHLFKPQFSLTGLYPFFSFTNKGLKIITFLYYVFLKDLLTHSSSLVLLLYFLH